MFIRESPERRMWCRSPTTLTNVLLHRTQPDDLFGNPADFDVGLDGPALLLPAIVLGFWIHMTAAFRGSSALLVVFRMRLLVRRDPFRRAA
ncbi:hypothetical protein [Methylobacterium symbioticum]|nr:hypothetical protein [Methylobacterium symbioticum]